MRIVRVATNLPFSVSLRSNVFASSCRQLTVRFLSKGSGLPSKITCWTKGATSDPAHHQDVLNSLLEDQWWITREGSLRDILLPPSNEGIERHGLLSELGRGEQQADDRRENATARMRME